MKTAPERSADVIADIDAELRDEYRHALYVVPDLQDVDALERVGLIGACATQPARLCGLARDVARGGSPIVLVATPDVAELAGTIRQEAPGADVRTLALPPGSRSVSQVLDYLPGVRTHYTDSEAAAKCETWLAWAGSAIQVGLTASPSADAGDREKGAAPYHVLLERAILVLAAEPDLATAGGRIMRMVTDERGHRHCVPLSQGLARELLSRNGLQVTSDVVRALCEERGSWPQLARIPAPRKATAPADVIDQWRGEGPLPHWPCGIAAIDDHTGGGLVPGCRAIVLGPPDAGKTLLLRAMADGYMKHGLAVGFHAIDEEAGDLLTRFLQYRGFRRGECERRDAADLGRMHAAMGSLPLRFYSAEWRMDEALDDLAATVKRTGAPGGVYLLDSLQTATCADEAGAESVREQVSARVRTLRRLSMQHRILSVATSEQNRGAYRNRDSRANGNPMASGKESSDLEYQARVMVTLENVDADRIELRIIKNKLGPRTRDDERGGFLFIDRSRQDVIDDRLYRPESGAGDSQAQAKKARTLERLLQDAAAVAVCIAEDPGVAAKALESRAAIRAGGMSRTRFSQAREKLGAAVVEVPGERTAKLIHLAGSEVPKDVLDAVPVDSRPKVLAANPPPALSRPETPASRPRAGSANGMRDAPPSPIGVGAARLSSSGEDVSGQMPQEAENGGGSTATVPHRQASPRITAQPEGATPHAIYPSTDTRLPATTAPTTKARRARA